MAELTRSLTRLNATAMVAGTIIGASIFVQPSEIARHLDTPASIMLAWAACGLNGIAACLPRRALCLMINSLSHGTHLPP